MLQRSEEHLGYQEVVQPILLDRTEDPPAEQLVGPARITQHCACMRNAPIKVAIQVVTWRKRKDETGSQPLPSTRIDQETLSLAGTL